MADKKIYQLIIVGSGPAGQSAGIYAKQYGLDFIVIGQISGGTVNEAHRVENYLGFKSISGPDLAKEFAKHLDMEPVNEEVKKITKQDNNFRILTDKNEYQCQSLILAMGMKNRKLGFINEDKFLNKGIFYYSPNDIKKVADKIIAVVGGGDSALTTAIKLSAKAKKVYIIHRRDEWRAAPGLVANADKIDNIEFVLSAQIKEVKGNSKPEKILLNTDQELEVDEIYIEVGGVPNTALCQELNIDMEGNFIKVNKDQATNIAGVFAAGDVTDNPFKQIITAAGEGAIAAFSCFKHLKRI